MTDRPDRRQARRRLRALAAAAAWAAVLLAAAAPPALSQARATFEVLRNGEPIGEHVIRYGGSGDQLVVEIRTRVSIELLGLLGLYRFSHDSREVWQRHGHALRLVELSARTDDDGEEAEVQGRATEQGFLVAGEAGTYTVPADIVPASYWNVELRTRSQLLGTRHGELLEVRVEDLGYGPIEAAGRGIEARHFRVSGDRPVELWYDEQGYLLRLAFPHGEDFVEYRLTALQR